MENRDVKGQSANLQKQKTKLQQMNLHFCLKNANISYRHHPCPPMAIYQNSSDPDVCIASYIFSQCCLSRFGYLSRDYLVKTT